MNALKNVLLINSVSSGLTGLGLVIMPRLYARLFDVGAQLPFILTGVFLIGFAAVVFVEWRRPEVDVYWVRFIIVLDVMWVIASVAITGLSLLPVSVLGYLLIGGVALWVGLMAYLQHTYLRRALASQQ
ncbi:MAG: hypothetical protein AB7O48_14660 [Cyclobacteriaceae bacterium]